MATGYQQASKPPSPCGAGVSLSTHSLFFVANMSTSPKSRTSIICRAADASHILLLPQARGELVYLRLRAHFKEAAPINRDICGSFRDRKSTRLNSSH